LYRAEDINDLGQIVGYGKFEGETYGFLLTPISEISIDYILSFFDESVEEGTLYGQGERPFLANFRLWIMREMLETVKNLIEKDEIEYACKALNRAFLRCDSDPWPIDFVEGEAVEELADMILELMDELGCE
jgi:hypothetical protein